MNGAGAKPASFFFRQHLPTSGTPPRRHILIPQMRMLFVTAVMPEPPDGCAKKLAAHSGSYAEAK